MPFLRKDGQVRLGHAELQIGDSRLRPPDLRDFELGPSSGFRLRR
jgi:hypothetical protein